MSSPSQPTVTPPTCGADPHFVCPLQNGQRLCFSLQGEPDFMFNLFSDVNIQVNAKFSLPHSDESHSLINGSTFIQEMGLIFRTANNKNLTTKMKLSALDHSVTVSGHVVTVSNKPVTITITKGTLQIATSEETSVTTKSLDETALVTIISDVGFGVKVKFVKKHLDMIISDTSGLSKKAHGIQGT